jgi:hypothetical protein
MTLTPMRVDARPFAVEPLSGVMLPDGIFDNALHELRITCHYTNASNADLADVDIYLEATGDPGILPVAQTHHFPRIPSGASVLVAWDADFEHATPGKRLVSFVATAGGFEPARAIQQIFVSETRFDVATNTYTCRVEEGTLRLSDFSAITSGPPPGHVHGGKCVCEPDVGPDVVTGVTMVWTPNPPFAGTHGDLPFSDPWWKVLGWIVFAVAALVAIVAEATSGGTVSIGAKGTFEENDPSVSCCTPDAGPSTGTTVASVASAIAAVGLAVGLSDAADPMWRGQEATPPQDDELTVGERVEAKWLLPEAPNAGVPFTAEVDWTYTRFTTGQTYDHSVSETQTNIHTADGVTLDTPATVHPFDPLWVRARFDRGGGIPFVGTDLYAFVLFRSPGGLFILRELTDDGLGFDPEANDGVYACFLDLKDALRLLREKDEADLHGRWRVYVFAQDVDQSPAGQKPEISAQEIGGFFVASAVHLTFDPSLPCPLEATATIDVT